MNFDFPLANARSILQGHSTGPQYVSRFKNGVLRLNQPFESNSSEWKEMMTKLIAAGLEQGVACDVRFIMSPRFDPTRKLDDGAFDVDCDICFEETVRSIDAIIKSAENFVASPEYDDLPRRMALLILGPDAVNPDAVRFQRRRTYVFTHASKSLKTLHEIFSNPTVRRCSTHKDRPSQLHQDTHICEVVVRLADSVFYLEFYK